MQPHHPHRRMRTRGWVPLILMACRPHWKTQPYWEPRFPCWLRFQKKCRNFFPTCHGAWESIQMNGLSCPCKTRPAEPHRCEPGLSIQEHQSELPIFLDSLPGV
ncbi:unnamed protein product [Staurois parvus]|uniref:Secreted protein n=1 Tax=Staurois parvus TaxID=386267 RepID=A0ABN9ET81_9NEOB|nr:unnamed protein product [Staurois parvus]